MTYRKRPMSSVSYAIFLLSSIALIMQLLSYFTNPDSPVTWQSLSFNLGIICASHGHFRFKHIYYNKHKYTDFH